MDYLSDKETKENKVEAERARPNKGGWLELKNDLEAKAKLPCIACGRVHRTNACNDKERLESLRCEYCGEKGKHICV